MISEESGEEEERGGPFAFKPRQSSRRAIASAPPSACRDTFVGEARSFPIRGACRGRLESTEDRAARFTLHYLNFNPASGRRI